MIVTYPEERYADVNGLRRHYLDWGYSALRPMLLLHGFMGHAHMWDCFAEELRSHYHVIALDQRGHGKSEWARDSGYSIDDHFSDISCFVELTGIKEFVLVGHSMGGRNALWYTACRPEKVDRLILVEARPGNSSWASRTLKQLLTKLSSEADSLHELTKAILPLPCFRHLLLPGETRL